MQQNSSLLVEFCIILVFKSDVSLCLTNACIAFA